MKELLIAAILAALSTSVLADQKRTPDELDICGAKYKLAMDVIRADLKYKVIDDATFTFLAHRAMVALAACQYQAAAANEALK